MKKTLLRPFTSLVSTSLPQRFISKAVAIDGVEDAGDRSALPSDPSGGHENSFLHKLNFRWFEDDPVESTRQINKKCRFSSEEPNRHCTAISKAFSLLELVVTVAIIGVLSAVAIPLYRGHVEKARAEVMSANAVQVVNLIEATFARCMTGETLIPIGTSGSINCQSGSHHSEISAMLHVFSNHLSPLLGPNPYDKARPAIVVAGQQQPSGTIRLDYGVSERGQCGAGRVTGGCVVLVTHPGPGQAGFSATLFLSRWTQ